MEFLLQQAFTTILISVLVEIVVANNLPKWRKKEKDEQRAAIEEKRVFFTRIMIKQITVIIAVLIICGLLPFVSNLTLYPFSLIFFVNISMSFCNKGSPPLIQTPSINPFLLSK